MTDFEKQVIADLTELKAQMRIVVGNGREGWIQSLQARVDRHERYLNRAGGIAAAFAAVVTLLNLALNYLRLHR